MENKKQHKKNPFSLFFIMFMVMLIAVSSGFVFFYYSVYNKASKKEIITERAAELGTSEQYFSNLFDAMIRQMNAIRYTKEIYTWNKNNSYQAYHAVIDLLRDNKAKHSAIHSIYVVFEDEDLVLTSNEGYFSTEKFYDDTWKKYGTDEMQSLNSLNNVEVSYTHRLTPRSINSADVISLVCKLNTGALLSDGNEEPVWMVFNISMNKIINVIDADAWADNNGRNELAIISGTGKIIYDGTGGALDVFLNDPENLLNETVTWSNKTSGNTNLLCQKVRLPQTGWYLLRISEINVNEGSVALARKFMLGAVAICIVAIIFVLGLIWKQVYLPYNRMMEKARKGDMLTDNENSMEYLEQSIAQVLDTKRVLMESWLERILLSGRFEDNGKHNILELSEFFVILISVRELTDMVMTGFQLTTLKSGICQYFIGGGEQGQKEFSVTSCHCISMNDHRLAVIVETREHPDKKAVESCMHLLKAWVETQWNLNIFMGISMLHEGVDEIHKGYIEAKDSASIYYFFPNRTLFYYSDTCHLQREFYIENTVKVDIFTNNLYGMKIDEAKEAFEIIVSDIRKEIKSVIYYNLPNFFSRIFERVYRAVRNIGLEPSQFFELTTSEDINVFNTWEFDSMNEAINALYRMLDKLQEYQNEQAPQVKKRNKQWAKLMLEYVDANYDKGISLATMAEELGLEETYLSKQFKEKIGISFVQYVTKCRIDKAKELLADPTIKIAEISEMVGMGNAQSFIRVFKKYEGETPGKYRETCLERN